MYIEIINNAVEAAVAGIVSPITDQLAESQTNLVNTQAQVTDLQAQIAALDTAHAAELSKLEADIAAANDAVATRDANIADLKAQLATSVQNAAAKDAKIADLTNQIVALNATITGLNSTITNLRAQIAALQTTTRPTGPNIVPFETLPKLARIDATANQVADGKQVSFDKGVFESVDFAANGYMDLFWTNVYGIRGSGSKNTSFQMKPNTSTAASKVPAQPDKRKTDGSTNQLYLVRGGGNGDVTPRATVYSGFTIQGTPQGHMYNGLSLYQQRGGSIDDVAIRGIPGDSSVNPGETFSLNLFRSNDVKITNLEIDGRDLTGNIVGASGIGLNFVNNFDISDSYIHHSKEGAGITAYQSTGTINYTNVRSENHRVVAFNFEGNTLTAANLRNCSFIGSPCGDLIVDAINAGASSVINVFDPKFDRAKFVVVIHNTAGQRQKASDIHLFIGGVERPDMLQIVSETLVAI